MSFYRSFASKDDLVAEYLQQKTKGFWAWWDDIVAARALLDAYTRPVA